LDLLRDNLARVRARIQEACRRAGRDPSSVILVAVTKTVPVDAIRQAVSLGVSELGENRVQEAREKRARLADAPVRWHLIGHLQRNKARHAVELFQAVHSLDSAALAGELERQAAGQAGRGTLDVFVQVNVSGEATKSGCRPEEALGLARQVVECRHLRLAGLMTMAPFLDDPQQARPQFRQLRILRDEMQAQLGHPSLQLSMGMSHDFEVAVEEGADVVRIGTAIFGERT